MAESNPDIDNSTTFARPRPKRKRTPTYKAKALSENCSDVTDSEEDLSSESFVPNSSDDVSDSENVLNTSDSDFGSTHSLMDTCTSDTEQDVHTARDKSRWSELVPDVNMFVDECSSFCSSVPESIGEINSISGCAK